MGSDAKHRSSEATRLPAVAAVLAGGRSRRMGTDKRSLRVGGQSMLSRVVGVASLVCRETMVVVARDEKRIVDVVLGDRVAVVRDSIPNIGPLGGLITAFESTDSTWIVVLAADMPFVQPDAIRLLWAFRRARGAVAFSGPRGFEPLLALYHRDCLAVARDLLMERRASPRTVLERVETVAVPFETLRGVDPQLHSVVNVNTPHEYTIVLQEEALSPGVISGLVPDLVHSGLAEEARNG